MHMLAGGLQPADDLRTAGLGDGIMVYEAFFRNLEIDLGSSSLGLMTKSRTRTDGVTNNSTVIDL